MKKLKDWAAVQQVYKQTNSKRATAKILGISRNTVRKLLELDHEPEYKRARYPTKIDAFKEQIIEWRCEPYLFNGTRIFRELKKRGYEGSIGPVYNFLRKVDEDCDGMISSKATTRVETPPGDQAQFDWSEYQMHVAGCFRTVYCFAMILAASRKKAVCFSLREDADAIYEAIQELFEDLGGVTIELLIDNPKALVLENNPKSEDEIKYNPHALLLAKHLGTELNACPCYWPRKKGKIENPFVYIEEQFVKGNSFATMEELNRRGKDFINAWCDEKHGTTKRIPNEHYLLEEKVTLLPIPKKRYRKSPLQSRKVSTDSFVSINSNKYSVPVKYVDKKVFFRIVYGFRIEIYTKGGDLILKKEVSYDKRQIIKEDVHYEAIAPRTATSIPQIRRDFTRIFSNGESYLQACGKKSDQPTHHARRILELRDMYDDEILDELIRISIDLDCMDIKSFKTILKSYNSGELKIGDCTNDILGDVDEAALTRDCDYYEKAVAEVKR